MTSDVANNGLDCQQTVSGSNLSSLQRKSNDNLWLIITTWQKMKSKTKFTSRPVGTCLASLTLAKLPLPMVLISRYLPMCGSSRPRFRDDVRRGGVIASSSGPFCNQKETNKHCQSNTFWHGVDKYFINAVTSSSSPTAAVQHTAQSAVLAVEYVLSHSPHRHDAEHNHSLVRRRGQSSTIWCVQDVSGCPLGLCQVGSAGMPSLTSHAIRRSTVAGTSSSPF